VKSFYLDTNVFLARYAPREKEHESCRRLFAALETGHLRAVTSTLTLVEIASSVRRAGEKFGGASVSPETPGAFVRRALSTRNLSFVGMGSEISIGRGPMQARVPAVFAIALKAVKQVSLRTLDLLHVASAFTTVRMGETLDFFATLDAGILESKRALRQFLGCPIITPSELVELEAL
jgi:predicted nucleic acid-binding protein